jgi:hypothetical protein
MKTAALRTFFLAFLTIAPAAHAVTAAAGDLILGFKATGGMGADTNLEVNLGPASDFYGAAPGSATVLTKLSVQDLVETYGGDWATRSDLFWGVAGTTGVAAVSGVPARTIWASRPEATPGTASTPWLRGATFTLQVPSNTISTLYTGAPGSIDRFTATPNSAFSSIVNAAETGSWTAQETFTPGVSFRYFNPSVMNAINTFPAVVSAYDGTAYTVLDLFEVRPGTAGSPGTLIGGIGINSAGKLVFSTDITKFGPGGGSVVLGQPGITYNANGTVSVTLTNVPDGSYTLRRSTTMAAGSWTTLFTQSPTSGTLSFNDPNPPQPRGYYVIGTAP